MRMVIVVPPFSKYDEGHENIIHGSVFSVCLEWSGAHFVADRVNEAKRMEHRNSVKQSNPDQKAYGIGGIEPETRRLERANQASYDKGAEQ